MFALFKKDQAKNSQTQTLLDSQELKSLYIMAGQLDCSTSPLQVLESRQAGNLTTRALGSGLDYAESRPYQPGDDPRSINWRLSARSSETFVKTYHIEARPILTIMLDNRQSLYFGTRLRLKIMQALRLAALLGYASDQHQLGFKGWIIDETTLTEYDNFEHFLKVANSNPTGDNQAIPQARHDLNNALAAINETSQQGSLVYILSDFYDLKSNTLLSQLDEKCFVQALHLVDPAEYQLPAIGKLRLQGSRQSDTKAVQINTSKHREREQFLHFAHQALEQKERMIRNAGVFYTRVMSDDQTIHERLQLPLGQA